MSDLRQRPGKVLKGPGRGARAEGLAAARAVIIMASKLNCESNVERLSILNLIPRNTDVDFYLK